MQHVAFLRNVNQGQRGHPSTADILNAFADAGAVDATAFRSNGTIVFESAVAHEVAVDAMGALAARSGVDRDTFVIPLAELAQIVHVHAGAVDPSRLELTLHAGGVIDVAAPQIVCEAAHRRCRILDAGEGWAVSENERDRESNATPVVERITGVRASSRGFPTLQRLLDRFAAP